MAKIIKTDGTEIDVVPENGAKYFGLDQMQQIVGGLIEVARADGLEHKVLVINEDGRGLELPVNLKASRIFGDWLGFHSPDTLIVGDVLLANEVFTNDGWEIC